MVLLAGRQAFRLCASGQLAAGDTGVSSLFFDSIISLSLGLVLGRIRVVRPGTVPASARKRSLRLALDSGSVVRSAGALERLL